MICPACKSAGPCKPACRLPPERRAEIERQRAEGDARLRVHYAKMGLTLPGEGESWAKRFVGPDAV